MSGVERAEVQRRVGEAPAFIVDEILRVKATLAELDRAVAFVSSDTGRDPRAYATLPPRLRRLVDLIIATEGAPRAA